MKKNNHHWAVPLTGVVLFSTAVSAEQDKYTYLDSTNRITLSLRFGLNISGKFSGIGGSMNPAALGNGHYDDGYVLPDNNHNAGGVTWNWGYDTQSASAGRPTGQWNTDAAIGLGYADSIYFDRTTASGIPAAQNADANPYPGFELTYDRKFGEKENWHHMFYGLESAVNYMKFSFQADNTYNAAVTTTTYIYLLPGTTPPAAPFQGTFTGPNAVLEVPFVNESSSLPSAATLLSQDHFDANLWGLRLGPYVEFPFSDKLSLHLSGGLALGVLDGQDSWKETLTPGGTT